MIENTILNKNKQGLKALSFSLTSPSLYLVELAAHVGFDAINCDGEHGAFTPESIDDIVRVANGYGMSVTARVPNREPNTINLWLDRGIQGITGPHVETGEEAQALADACLFPTDGWRSWGGGRGTEFNDQKKLDDVYGGKLGFAKWSNANMIVVAQIESKKAWDNLDDILNVKGLTGVTGGPHDFSASLGHPGEPNHSDRVAATEEVDRRARAAGKTAGGDMSTGTGIQEMMLGYAREFVAKHKNDAVSS
ncbi:MAG: aldolase/citrate lyase family protein [Dehalococcoidia bacterium]